MANYILKVFLEANQDKVEQAVQKAAQETSSEDESETITMAM